MLKNIEVAVSNNKTTSAIFISSVIGISIGYAMLFSCINNANKIDAMKKTSDNTALIRKDVNAVNNVTYLSTAIIATSVSLGLAGFLREA